MHQFVFDAYPFAITPLIHSPIDWQGCPTFGEVMTREGYSLQGSQLDDDEPPSLCRQVFAHTSPPAIAVPYRVVTLVWLLGQSRAPFVVMFFPTVEDCYMAGCDQAAFQDAFRAALKTVRFSIER